MAVAAATAVIAPAAFLSAPAAFADPSPTPTETASSPSETASASPSETVSSTPSATATTPAADQSSTPAATPSTPATSSAATPSATASEPGDDEEDPDVCKTSDLELSIKGLPGKIAAGSGWHKFTLNVYNSSKTIIKEIDYVAGAASDEYGENLFKTKQVELQSLDPVTNTWETLDEDGQAVGYVASSNELKPGYEVNLPLRVNVKASAPVGVGFTLGGGFYIGDKDCLGFNDVAYKFQIVKAGTDTDGTKPQEGGKAPVPSEKPSNNTAGNVTGNLASTGSSSMLPTVGIAGGIAIVAGAGVVFAMKRRRSGDATA
ncbi:LPXTG cell wall anchor domain-containing protein [Streptomyces sp. NBC_00322]|uniref:LPXTG cell wall anchor domain-containing protein n=1 Tax=Streptomyces sp. NBC_00322 TaxID=2975712 RepID=UPI002E2ACE0D|nr:LPXTG cell wall anchor domain-containing protein [Streptomyces sp. NBC_00322]